jgi:Rhodanese-related sulfurtransferase
MPSVTIAELQSRVPVQSQLIDVRSLSEFAAGHIPGAINIPMDQIESRLDDLCSTVPIILVCQMGTRARMTAALLESCRSDLAILEGGTAAWDQAGRYRTPRCGGPWSGKYDLGLACSY